MVKDDDVRWLAVQSILAALLHELDKTGQLGVGRNEILRRSKALVKTCMNPRMDRAAADKFISGVNEVMHQIR